MSIRFYSFSGFRGEDIGFDRAARELHRVTKDERNFNKNGSDKRDLRGN